MDHRRVYLDSGGSLAEATIAVYERNTLRPGDVIAGPAIIQEDESTFYLEASFQARIDEMRYISASKKESTS